MISRYPDGAAGAALLLLRFSLALIVYAAIVRIWPAPASWWPAAIPSAALALALATGFATRAAALLLLVMLLANLFVTRGEILTFIAACSGATAALVLAGPGAYSIDAHRFGRRVIRLDARSPDRGGHG
ncbi:hypothetical protein [Sphingosinicella sp. CPCC 101087]|uniref:hypothetical protein n=1 Tax=Sphingosinicella sp. CPCC 101087 TaxID=2497754 RepID=UPI00101C36EC|nr:hypothetical protein [Sphingosinicella sp. CPCC 101087]